MTFALWTLLILMCLNWFCAAYAKKLSGFSLKGDNHDPRGFLAKTEGKAARLNAAQQNGYEIFAPYAAAVLVAHYTGNAADGTMNFWATVFILSRLAFIWCYANDKPTLRSYCWIVGFGCIVALFIAAA
ncbi:MAPEG family protein [Neisseriaceae bacterium B1]